MVIRWLGCVPVPVLIRGRLPKRKDGGEFDGYNYGPIIAIRRGKEADAGLIRHELEHARQFYVTFGLHLALYPLCRRYRLWAERQACKAQGVPMTTEWY